MGWAGTTLPLAAYRGGINATPAAPAAPAIPATPPGYAGPGGSPLTAGSFPVSGFRSPDAFSYLMQALGLGGMSTPSGPSAPPSPLDSFGQQNFGGIFQQLLSSFAQPQSFTPTAGSMVTGTPSQPGPAPNPFGVLNQFSGPLGNGGGYMQPTKNIQPITIKSPPRMFY
jgi:hypothetical protein